MQSATRSRSQEREEVFIPDERIKRVLTENKYVELTQLLRKVLKLSAEELISVDRSLMFELTKVIDERILLDAFLNRLELEVETNPRPADFTEQVFFENKYGLLLNLREKVQSCFFEGHPGLQSKRLFSSQLLECLTSMKPLNPERANAPLLVFVDLSDNMLQEMDMKHILIFINALGKQLQSRITMISIELTFNRFHGHLESERKALDDSLIALLKHPAVVAVNISRNPFASVDRKDFFEYLFLDENADFQYKLIFVPSSWLSAGGWYNLVPEKHRKNVESYHRRYYERRSHF